MKKAPSPLVSLIPIVVLVLLLFATIRTFGSDALSGGSQVSLLTTTAICILIGMVFYKIPWKDYELAITNNIAGVATAIIILLIIGALSGIWMISGVVPTLIYYGMQIIHRPHPDRGAFHPLLVDQAQDFCQLSRLLHIPIKYKHLIIFIT